MRYVFIGGIPTAGKSYLAKKVADALGIAYFQTDHWRDDLQSDPETRRWVDFFWNQDEEKYWRETDCDQQWENLKNQSEAFWPAFSKKIKNIQADNQPAVFEGVNILPHLARRDLDFPGIFLLGESYEKILERNKKEPRWEKSEFLQEQEAKAFWSCERMQYQKEAEKYGFKTFNDSFSAENELLRILKS